MGNVSTFLEAAYEMDSDDDAWFAALTRAFRPLLGTPPDCVAALGYRLPVHADQALDFLMAAHEDISATDIAGALNHYPLHVMEQLLQDNDCRSLHHKVATSAAGPELLNHWEQAFVPLGFKDLMGVNVRTADGTGFLFFGLHGAPLREQSPPNPRHLQRLAAHAASALRIRTQLDHSAPIDHGAAAVLSPDGRTLHATGSTRPSKARILLASAVSAIERARTRGLRKDPNRAQKLWQALLDGQWSLIQRHDSDGRRLYIAIENPPSSAALHRLTPREQEVVAHIARGHSDKLTGHHLGISEAAVSAALFHARQKLHLGSRVDLIRVATALGAT